jgi:hypothetical protein
MRLFYCSGLWLILASQSASAQELIVKRNFEAGLSGRTVWSAPPTPFWNAVWLHAND